MIQYVLLLANGFVIALGGLAAFISFKAYRQNCSFPMLCLTIGFSLIVASPVLAMVLLSYSQLGLMEIQTIESALIAFGFLYVVHSIFTNGTVRQFP